MSDNWQTKNTLIQRARQQTDEKAWEEFVTYYRGYITMVVRKISPKHSDEEDIVQSTLLRIWKQLPKFDIAGQAKFRTWLYALTRNSLFDYLRKHSKHRQPGLHNIDGSLEPRSEAEIDEIIGNEWKSHITRLAMNAVAKQFSGKAMKVFAMSMKGCTAKEISAALELTVDSVYSLKNRVKTLLMQQIQELRNELEL